MKSLALPRQQKRLIVIILLTVGLYSCQHYLLQNSSKQEQFVFNQVENNNVSQSYTGCLRECLDDITDYRDDYQGFCGKRADKRGLHQKVASFVFYGSFESGYYRDIKEVLATIETYYPGWVMRLHVDGTKMEPVPKQQLCELVCDTGRLDICPINKIPELGDISGQFGMLWRFIPMADPTVDIMISRDLDSRFTERETAAVDDWLQTGLPFHAMRDNPYHNTAILGGMWGVRLDTGYREKYKDLLVKLIFSSGSKFWRKGVDQNLLATIVWPEVKNEAAVHDSYLCSRYPTPNNRPFPTQRRDEILNFVGAIGEMKIDHICPEECRPKDHKDWLTC